MPRYYAVEQGNYTDGKRSRKLALLNDPNLSSSLRLDFNRLVF